MQTETTSVKRFDFFGLRDYEAPYVEPVVEEVIEEDAAVQVEEAPAPPPEVTFSEAEMESAKAAAKQEGYQQGLLEADAATQKEIQAQNDQSINLLKQIQQQLSTLHMEYEKQVDALTHDSNALSLLVANMIAGKALAEDMAAPAEALLRECLPHLMQMPDVSLCLHPETASALDGRINAIAAEHHFAGNITIEKKESLAAHDAIVSWKGGSAEQRLSQAWHEIKGRILPESYYGHLEQNTSAPLPEETTPIEVAEEKTEVVTEDVAMETEAVTIEETVIEATPTPSEPEATDAAAEPAPFVPLEINIDNEDKE